MARISRPVSSVALAALLLAGGCGAFSPRKIETKTGQKVEKGDLEVNVIETGSLQAAKVVEIKSRVSGRVKRLYVEEGQFVTAGQLIAEIDPQETQLQVDQNSAQVRGAVAGAKRQDIEIAQRRVTAANALDKARSNLRQVQMELKVQPDLTRSGVMAAKSALDSAKQSYDQLVKITQPNAVTAANISAKDADNSLGTADRELARLKRLHELGYVSLREVESANLQVQLAGTKKENVLEANSRLEESQRLERQQGQERIRQAQADYDRTQANTIQDRVKREQYARAVKDVSDAEAQIRDVASLRMARVQQSAQIQQLQSVLSDGQRQLRETRIVAPISGLVTEKLVQEGELVASLNSFSAGSTIIRVEDRSRLQVKLNINEIDVAKLSIGTKAEVAVDAFSGETFSGHVTKIAPASVGSGAANAQAVSADSVVKYKVEVTLDKPAQKLKTGMSAKCTMSTLELRDVLKVPVAYLGRDDKGEYLLAAPANKKDPKAKGTRMDVKAGAKSATYVEIKSGATEGQEIVKPDYKGPKRQGMMNVSVDEE